MSDDDIPTAAEFKDAIGDMVEDGFPFQAEWCGVVFFFEDTGLTGIRRRWWVTCETCGECVHEATTRPAQVMHGHLVDGCRGQR